MLQSVYRAAVTVLGHATYVDLYIENYMPSHRLQQVNTPDGIRNYDYKSSGLYCCDMPPK